MLTDAGTQIAPSTYYAAKTRPPSARSVSDAATTTRDRAGPRATTTASTAPARCTPSCAGRAIRWPAAPWQRLMRAAGLRGISRAKGPRTTVPGTGPDTRPDLVERAFTATAPNQLWVADITYCRTFAGWVYAAFVIDVLLPPGRRLAAVEVACAPTWPSTPWRWGCGPARHAGQPTSTG